MLSAAPWARPHRTGEVFELDATIWLVPSEATKVVTIGQNYRKHAEEMGKPVPVEPLIFMKPMTALNAHGSPILMPPASNDVQHEAELALVIGQKLTRATDTYTLSGSPPWIVAAYARTFTPLAIACQARRRSRTRSRPRAATSRW